ncbi:hypothetical protein M9H77_18275 [Catharanthus roseus]|uniref:Uncharacterized protein n=1 Tax=Catharanthus roseus TaxID=4058 RepID=A0ACC0B760_CATRO|nr:hypothetical protein M9H77_18275 [Catharanthus roseus]
MKISEHGNRSDTSMDYLFQLLCFLKLHTYTRVQVSIDICGVDYPSRKRRFEVVYNLLSTRFNSRIRVQTCVDEVTRISPVVSLFPSASCWEREVWDIFGVSSINHPDVRCISTDYVFEGHPLRKDHPLSGFVEVRYDDLEKRMVSEPIEMTQEFRYFDFASPWEPRNRKKGVFKEQKLSRHGEVTGFSNLNDGNKIKVLSETKSSSSFRLDRQWSLLLRSEEAQYSDIASLPRNDLHGLQQNT